MQPETSRFPTPEYLVVNVKPTLNASQANSLGLRILQDSVAFSSVDVACAPRLRGQTDGYFGLTRKHSCRTYGVLPIATTCFQCAMGFQHYITHCTCCAVCVDNDVLRLIVCTASKSTRLASIPILMAFFVVSKLTQSLLQFLAVDEAGWRTSLPPFCMCANWKFLAQYPDSKFL